MIALSDVKLQFSWRCPLSETHEGSSLIQDWEIVARTMGDAFSDNQPVGAWRVIIVPVAAPSPKAWFASQNSDAARFQHLWAGNGWLRPELVQPRAVMIVAEAQLSDWARGSGLGLGMVLSGMIVQRLLPGVSHVALHPHPMTYSGPPNEHALAVGKIERLWAHYGAEKLDGPGDLWVIDLDMALPHDRLDSFIEGYRQHTEMRRHAGRMIG